jgi:hypothetical protein
MKCTGCEKKDALTSGNPMIVFTFVGEEGKAKNKRFNWYCSLNANVLWKLKHTLHVLGIETPDEPFELDLDDVVGIEVVGSMGDHEYDRQTSSRLLGIRELEDDKAVAIKKRPELTADEVREMAEDELEDVVDKYELELDLSAFKTLRRKADAVIAALKIS